MVRISNASAVLLVGFLVVVAIVNSASAKNRHARLNNAIILANQKKNQAAEMRQILMGDSNSPRRQQLIRMIAEMVKSKTGECPKSLPAEMCKQPLTFFMWLNEVRNQAKEKEMHNAVRNILVKMLAGQ